jgi:imidazolonepropionase-like amidohydrolase
VNGPSPRSDRRRVGVFAAALLSASLAHAQAPAAQLAVAPADAQQFAVLSPAGTHGPAQTWIAADGRRMFRESVLLRGQVWDLDEAVRVGPGLLPIELTVRGVSPRGDAAETFAVANHRATWHSRLDAGGAAISEPAFYVAAGGTRLANSKLLLEALLAAPGHSLALAPRGRAQAERLSDTTVGSGAARTTVVAWAVTGVATTPLALWSTQDDKFFGAIGPVAVLPHGYEFALAALRKAQDDALAVRSKAVAAKLLHGAYAGPVAFVNVRAFLDGKTFVDQQTVIVVDGRIVRVGPTRSTFPPKSARIIQGAGHTLVAGLWDSHMHISEDAVGPMLLSLGITSARDPGNPVAPTLARRARRANGELVGPMVYPSVLIDGKGPNSSQSGVIAESLEDALVVIRKARADHFTGVKIYGSFNPSWVAPAAAEAHRLGLHVHGHLPAGMRPSEAIAAGFDELTHIYFVMMEAMPDDVVATSNGINRFEGTGRYAKDVDLERGPIRALLAMMAKRQIAADPTLIVAEALFVPEPGELTPAYGPYVDSVPPITARSFREGGFAVPKGLTREDYRKSFAKLRELVGAMHAAGIPILAGTDWTGMELVRELELYVAAGFTPAEALACASVVPARVMGVAQTTGSIAAGKTADLVLVRGDPSRDIGELRNTRMVMTGGKLFDADVLRAAGGFTGRPQTRAGH